MSDQVRNLTLDDFEINYAPAELADVKQELTKLLQFYLLRTSNPNPRVKVTAEFDPRMNLDINPYEGTDISVKLNVHADDPRLLGADGPGVIHSWEKVKGVDAVAIAQSTVFSTNYRIYIICFNFIVNFNLL